MNSEVVEKIKKLLALATSPNEHEARLAAEKAADLLLRHNLKTQDLRDAWDYQKKAALDRSRPAEHTKWVVSIVKKHFFVEVVNCPYWYDAPRVRLWLVGEDTNVQVATYVFIFLHRTFPELWRQFHKINRRSKARNYYRGLHAGLSDQLNARRKAVERDSGVLLVTDPNLPAAVQIHFGETNTRNSRQDRVRYSRAYAAGFADGRRLTINTAVTNRRSEQSSTLSLDGRGQE